MRGHGLFILFSSWSLGAQSYRHPVQFQTAHDTAIPPDTFETSAQPGAAAADRRVRDTSHACHAYRLTRPAAWAHRAVLVSEIRLRDSRHGSAWPWRTSGPLDRDGQSAR